MNTVRFGSSSKMKKLADYLGLSKSRVASFDLPCGYTCPMADICKSYADRQTGKITDGANCKFRCYGASIEALYARTRALHWANYDALRADNTVKGMADMILTAIPSSANIIRIHSFGDFYNKRYFTAWLKVIENRPDIFFIAYTKVLPYVKVERPANFCMVYSHGGKVDSDLADEPTAWIVPSIAHAQKMNLPVACQKHPADDYDYIVAQKSFAIVVHGTQPARMAV